MSFTWLGILLSYNLNSLSQVEFLHQLCLKYNTFVSTHIFVRESCTRKIQKKCWKCNFLNFSFSCVKPKMSILLLLLLLSSKIITHKRFERINCQVTNVHNVISPQKKLKMRENIIVSKYDQSQITNLFHLKLFFSLKS